LDLLASRQRGQGGVEKIMFKPNFRYTDKTVNNLTPIAVAREVILNSPLIPKWEVTLRREAIIRSAHSSTAIEGNRLSLEQVSDLAHGREVMATRKDKQEVLNFGRNRLILFLAKQCLGEIISSPIYSPKFTLVKRWEPALKG